MMSDAEAGECEGAENPQPEDEAHLDTCVAQVAGDASPEPAQRAPQPQGCADSSGDSGDSGICVAASENDDVNHSSHPGLPASRQDGGETGRGEELRAAPDAHGCEREEAEDRGQETNQHTWPPESDRAGNGGQEGDVDTACRDDEQTANRCRSVPGCDPNTGDSVQGSEGAGTQASAACGQLTDAVSSHHGDQGDTPPQDAASSSHPAPASDPDTAADSPPAHGRRDNPDTESDHSCPSPSESTAGSDATGQQEADVPQSLSRSSPASDDFVQTVPVAGKDDDQVPECDRETFLQSSCQTSVHIAQPRSCETVTSDPAPSSKSFHSGGSLHVRDSEPLAPSESVQTVLHKDNTECNDSSSPSQSGSPVSSHGVHRSPTGACDNSDDCVTAVSQHRSLPSQPPPSSHRSGESVSAGQEREMLGKTYFLDEDSDEEELLTELDAELHLRCSPQGQQRRAVTGPVRVPLNGLKGVDTNSELCKQFEEQLLQMQEMVLQREREIHRLKEEKTRQRDVSQEVITERDKLRAEVTVLRDKNSDDLYLPQIKELEYTISQQQGEIRQLKDKLTTHDAAAKRAIATLQSEMKAHIDKVTKLYEESCREKDSLVVKFAQAETKNIEAKCGEEKMEARVRDLLKEKEFTNNKMRAAMAEKQKAVGELKAKMGEMAVMQKELEKVKEELSSADYRIKWHQNKLKAELDAHRDTKLNLEKTTAKLKEAKEETDMIRKDCQAIVKTYQESEEVRSNSLDKELKMKETELMVKMKEYSDTEEIHQKTKQELDALKARHKDTFEELKTLKDKVQCLEEERLQAEQVQAKYQTIIQNQKAENAALSKQLATLHTLQEDFDRAQEMIKNLDSEVGSLKMANRDLQKDTDSCQTRESKMLTLQSELSRTNAMLRSENTSLNNQVATLSGEVQKLAMDIQDLETRFRNTTDQLEEERHKREEESNSLSSQLAVKSKESEEYKQKWEDEIDANKTWKRKHTSNVKDLTRQLQQAKKRLEMYESGSGGGGSGERDVTSMGSRTNSNGSLNSMDNSNQHNNPHTAAHHNVQLSNPVTRPPSQEPEFPVIREQVEVDKQLLIERIVKLQRSLARKNEKLDFVEEHIQQLVQEIKKKNRIIQGYVMREEAGILASDTMDANKALLTRKGGIMASVYSHQQQDGAMTLDLSLQINQKLQAVLEDTLLKNFTLKENLDTLGAEIARLSQENRRLQLHLQGVDTQ